MKKEIIVANNIDNIYDEIKCIDQRKENGCKESCERCHYLT